MYPSTPPETGRDSWPENRPGPAGPHRAPDPRGRPAGPDPRTPFDGPRPADAPRPPDGEADPEDLDADEELPPVPIRRLLSVAIAGFAGLLGIGLIFGAQTAGPGARLPFAVVVFGVQLLFVLAWTMAMRPPALLLVGGVAVAVAAAADAAAVLPQIAALAPSGTWPRAASSSGCSGNSSAGPTGPG
ncbi:hypothetical protein GCM10027615_19630 [Plantactinospora veratri]